MARVSTTKNKIVGEDKTASGQDKQRQAMEQRGLWRDVIKRYRRHQAAMLGLGVLTTIVLACVAAPLITSYDPLTTDIANRYSAPNPDHWLGTDDLGRDQLTRLLFGGRISLLIGFLAVVLSILIGTFIGAVAGYFGGWVDNLLMRFTDFVLAFPTLFLLILLVSVYGSQFWIIVLVIGGLRWMSTARLVRSSFLSIKQKEYIEAAHATGVQRRTHRATSYLAQFT